MHDYHVHNYNRGGFMKKTCQKCAKICQFSSLPSKCFQAVNDPNTKYDSKPHICAYNYNTRTGFRDHKKTWGSRVLSSTLLNRSPIIFYDPLTLNTEPS